MKEMTVPADADYLERVLEFIGAELDAGECPVNVQIKITMAAEEVFVNKVQYAYPDAEGEITVKIGLDKRLCRLSFSDSGEPYNPLEKLDDNAASGLGILMVKESVPDVEYAHADGENVLTLRQAW